MLCWCCLGLLPSYETPKRRSFGCQLAQARRPLKHRTGTGFASVLRIPVCTTLCCKLCSGLVSAALPGGLWQAALMLVGVPCKLHSSPSPPAAPSYRLALHALCYGNARAVAILWQRFLHQLRLQFWDLQCALPRMAAWGQAPAASPPAQGPQPGGNQSAGTSAQDSQAGSAAAAGQERSPAGSSGCLDGDASTAHAAAGVQSVASGGGMHTAPAPDLRCCLVHQKLQLLDVCIQQSLQRAQGCGVGAQGSQVGTLSCRGN